MFREATVAVIVAGVFAIPQLTHQPSKNDDLKRCAPRLVKRLHPKMDQLQLQKSEKTPGKDPVIAFQILESGEIGNPRIARSSGRADIDEYALEWVRSLEYNRRLGCGVVESKVDVRIDWR